MGLFITFEGIEGCGKSTQVGLLAAHLAELGIKVLTTREPGGCPIADAIRRILLDPENAALVPRAELLLYAAARAQHVTEVIQPALERGIVVICDRFTDATLVYQGCGRGIELEVIRSLNRLATSGTVPELTLLLDMAPEEGLRRATQRNTAADLAHEARFDREPLEFHGKIRQGYLSLAEQEARVRLIDAQGDITTVARRIQQVVDAALVDRGLLS